MDFVVFLKQVLLHSSKIIDDISKNLLDRRRQFFT
jgi:hypothetical protein